MTMDSRATERNHTSGHVALHTSAPRAKAGQGDGMTNPLGTSFDDLQDLPIQARVLDRLTAALVLADEILTELAADEGESLRWIEDHARRIYDEADAVMKRFAQ
jgi:hypothetical protein